MKEYLYYGLQYDVNNSKLTTMSVDNEVYECDNIRDLMDYYYSKKQNTKVYCLNLHIFTINYIKTYGKDNYLDISNAHLLKEDSYTYRFGESRSVCYSLAVKHNKKIIQFIDISNIIPRQDVEDLRKTFNGDTDIETVVNVVKFFIENDIDQKTIGKQAFKEYKNSLSNAAWNLFFPVQTEKVDSFVRKSYIPGWMCYKYNDNKIINTPGKTYDVNGLYSYVMKNYRLPYGCPTYFNGYEYLKYIGDDSFYFFIHIKASFKLKERAFPFIRDSFTKEYLTESTDQDLWLTKTDFIMFFDYYYVNSIEVFDGYVFSTIRSLFDKYIDKYVNIKNSEKGAKRLFAKLMLNNLYGKFGTKPRRFVTDIEIIDNKAINTGDNRIMDTVYVPIASAISSIANSITIKAAVDNYDNFIFSHTDSIHLTGDTVNGIEVDDKELGKWKIEREWTDSYFTREYNYVEHENTGNYKVCYFGLTKEGRNYVSKLLSYDICTYETLSRGIDVPVNRYLNSTNKIEECYMELS